MTCADVRSALLEADLDSLAGSGPGPVRAHLESCAQCRAALERVRRGTAALAADLARVPHEPAAAVAQAARIEGRRRRARARRLRVLVPLLAAASLAVFFVRDVQVRSPALQPPAPASAQLPPLVEAGGHDVAVITTTRPDVTVVWQF